MKGLEGFWKLASLEDVDSIKDLDCLKIVYELGIAEILDDSILTLVPILGSNTSIPGMDIEGIIFLSSYTEGNNCSTWKQKLIS